MSTLTLGSPAPSRAGDEVPPLAAGVFVVPPATFRSCFDRHSFPFEHTLSSNPLFKMERLAQLARQFEHKGKISYNAGDADVHGGWDAQESKPKRVESVFEAIDRIQSSGAWVKIKHTHEQPEYAEFLEALIGEMAELSGRPLRADITRISSTIFISSPGAVTPYHMDHETNFLFQIRGRKTYYLFDAGDPDVVSLAEIERFLACGDVRCRDEVQANAEIHQLEPGRGVHHPSCWPHWAKTGDEPSISLSINFCLRERDLSARVHQYNYYLRRLGIRPAPPGRSRIRDGLKKLAFASLWKRHPAKSIDEHVRGHLRRIEAPLDVLRWLRRRVRPHRAE